MAGLSPFGPGKAPRNPKYDFRAPKGRNNPFGRAPQAPFRKLQGVLALMIVYWIIINIYVIFEMTRMADIWPCPGNYAGRAHRGAGPERAIPPEPE